MKQKFENIDYEGNQAIVLFDLEEGFTAVNQNNPDEMFACWNRKQQKPAQLMYYDTMDQILQQLKKGYLSLDDCANADEAELADTCPFS